MISSFKWILIFVLLVIKTAIGQSYEISGTVQDQKTNDPIIGASIYIDGSSIGTITNENGDFKATHFPQPPFTLTISSVGYQNSQLAVDESTNDSFTIKLVPKINFLSEVTVSNALKDGWKRFGADFLLDFIGYSKFAEECKLTNPEVLSFYYDEKKLLLRIYAERPLKIKNKALGYTIDYWLDEFIKNYRTGILNYRGSSLYIPLEKSTNSKRKLRKWANNRQIAYNGSLMHFIRSLYTNSIETEGFEIRPMKKIKLERFYDNVPKKIDTVFFNNADVEKVYEYIYNSVSRNGDELKAKNYANLFLERIKTWYNDSTNQQSLKVKFMEIENNQRRTSIFEIKKSDLQEGKLLISKYPTNEALEKRQKNGLVNVVSDVLITANELVSETGFGFKYFSFDDYLYVTYLDEKEELNYLRHAFPFKEVAPNDQTSIISLQNIDQLKIFKNGFFDPTYGIFIEKYWSYEKLDVQLPLNYYKKSVQH